MPAFPRSWIPNPPAWGRTGLQGPSQTGALLWAWKANSKQPAEFFMFLSLRWRQKEKREKPYQGFQKGGRSLTATADVDQQISLENCASLQHLCWCHWVNGLCFPILTNFGARPLTRAAEHAVRKEGDIENKQWYATLNLQTALSWILEDNSL